MLLKCTFLILLIICIESVQLIKTENVLVKDSHVQLDDDSYPVVTVSQGQLQGLKRETLKGNTYYSFKGIPYAEPPIGSLRFRDPVPVNPWSGIRNASEDIKICAQVGIFDNIFKGEEDCLYLNAYTPKLPKDGVEKLPVTVYIHGGGLKDGSGTEKDLPPTMFVDNDIVFVTMNYRLGIFGLLSLDIPEVPGNTAFKDQHLAIKWVNQNIEYFNGDKDNVALYGLSAGSASVDFQLLKSESQGLFHKVSMQSGSSISSWSRPRRSERSLEKLSEGIGSVNEPYEILNKLSELTTYEVLKAAEEVGDDEMKRIGYLVTGFGPAIEKSFPNVENFITRDTLDLYKNGNFLKLPSLISFCKDEGKMFHYVYSESLVSEMLNRQYADFLNFLSVDDKDSVNGNLTALYTAMNISEDDQVDEFIADLKFLSGLFQNLKYMVKDVSNDHYSYMYSYSGNFQSINGALHGDDMLLMLSMLESDLNDEQLQVKKYLENIHVNFIKYGNPSASGISWDPSTEESFNVFNILGPNNGTMIPFPFADRMKYWDSLFV